MSTSQELPSTTRDDYLREIFRDIVHRTLTRWPGLVTRETEVGGHAGADAAPDIVKDVNVLSS